MDYKKIKTFNDACKSLGISNEIKIDVSELSKTEQKHFIADYKLIIIAKALNDGWKPNWKDTSERKWFPYFDMSGFGFSYSLCDGWHTSASVGSRLCFKSEELAKYSGTQFVKLYKDLLTVNGK